MKKSITVAITLLLLLSPTLVYHSTFSSQTLNQQLTIRISEGVPLTNALVFYKGGYAMIIDNITGTVEVNASEISDRNLTAHMVINSSLVYNNSGFTLPFGVIFGSGSPVSGGVVFYVLGYKGNLTLPLNDISSVTSSLRSNLTLYYLFFNGEDVNFTPIIRDANFTSVLTNGKTALALEKNGGKYVLVKIEGTKVVSSYPINLNVSGLELTSFSSNYVDLSTFSNSTNSSTVYVYNINTLDVVKTLNSGFLPSPVFNSNASLFLTYNDGEVNIVDSSGSVLYNVSVVGNALEAVMYYNSVLAVFTSLSQTGSSLTTYVFRGGQWVEYDTLSFSSSFLQQFTTPIGIESFPDQFRVILLTEEISTFPPEVTSTYSFYTVPYSKPETPKVSLTLLPQPGVTEALLSIDVPNATILGVKNISVYLNSTLIGVYPPTQNEALFNITQNGTYAIKVVASNIFGNTSVTVIREISVEPMPKITVTSPPPPTLTYTNTSTTYTQTSTSSTSTTSTTQSSTPTQSSTRSPSVQPTNTSHIVSSPTKPSVKATSHGLNSDFIIAGVVVILSFLVWLVLRKRSK
ncbi:hypothetical protein [Stygiolobus caldivivus]|uniref:Uncharacterized protein n=1 Tax=Stygiolobus caldivivus TaxID=2824673 RepID=A0A8D5ZIP6_9CREN|nr:hypothetical protein [Stygiolobus caldivivus]BCU69585.1 hypothetical protein KN1_08820 [Stygiolobus caldivivus]